MDPRGLLAGGAGGSAASGGGSTPAAAVGTDLLAPLPLITCIECRRFNVVRRVSKQPWSAGEVFYCCPAHKVKSIFLLFVASLANDLLICSAMVKAALSSGGRMST
jgi:hypothetical protein